MIVFGNPDTKRGFRDGKEFFFVFTYKLSFIDTNKYAECFDYRVRGALVAPPSFESAIESLKAFFQRFAREGTTRTLPSHNNNENDNKNENDKGKAEKEVKDAFALMMKAPKQDILTSLEQKMKENTPLMEEWVRDEITTWSQLVLNMNAASTLFEAKKVAMLGLLDTFAVAREVAFPGGSLTGSHDWLTTMKVPPPRVLQAYLFMLPSLVIPSEFTFAPEAQQLASELLHICGGSWTQNKYSLVLTVMESEYINALNRVGGEELLRC